MDVKAVWLLFVCFTTLGHFVTLTTADKTINFRFEVPQRDNYCFFQDINETESYVFAYFVTSGGDLDIDVVVVEHMTAEQYKLAGKRHEPIYKSKRQKIGREELALEPGTYIFCFNNHFSLLSPKIIHFTLKPISVGRMRPGRMIESDAEDTLVEATAADIMRYLIKVRGHQREYTIRDAKGMYLAHQLNGRVLWWSASQSIIVVVASLIQVYFLRRFFADKREKYKSPNRRVMPPSSAMGSGRKIIEMPS